LHGWYQNAGFEKDEKMYLLGHSFGGFIVTHYALKYPETIQKLLPMSPVGYPRKNKEKFDQNV
jgi:pimeloyl-ACP methyl ester carboxylesterase